MSNKSAYVLSQLAHRATTHDANYALEGGPHDSALKHSGKAVTASELAAQDRNPQEKIKYYQEAIKHHDNAKLAHIAAVRLAGTMFTDQKGRRFHIHAAQQHIIARNKHKEELTQLTDRLQRGLQEKPVLMDDSLPWEKGFISLRERVKEVFGDKV